MFIEFGFRSVLFVGLTMFRTALAASVYDWLVFKQNRMWRHGNFNDFPGMDFVFFFDFIDAFQFGDLMNQENVDKLNRNNKNKN